MYEKTFLLRLSLSRYDSGTRAKVFSYMTFTLLIPLVIAYQVCNYEKHKNLNDLPYYKEFLEKCPSCKGKYSRTSIFT